MNLPRPFPDIGSEAPSPAPLRVLSAEEFLQADLPSRPLLLEPWLHRRSLTMIYAPRGIGKTWLANAIALASSSGAGIFRGWEAPTPCRVLLVDGKMPARLLQERLSFLSAGAKYEPGGRLRILADDLQEEGLPSLSGRPGQKLIEAHVGDADLLILDNVSTLFRGLDENDGRAWDDVQSWLISLRRAGLAVVFVHHAGKGGQQRGTSKREDAIDTTIALKFPEDHTPAEGCSFELRFEKARGLVGKVLEPFEAALSVVQGRAMWKTRDIRDEVMTEMLRLEEEGRSSREIGKALGLHQSNVVRRLRRWHEKHGDRFIGPELERVTLRELLESLELHLATNGAKSIRSHRSHVKPIKAFFGEDRAIDVTTKKIERFITTEQAEKKASA
jgi:hypothetical protein